MLIHTCRRKQIEEKIGKDFADDFINNLGPVTEVETAEQTELIDFPEEPQLTADQYGIPFASLLSRINTNAVLQDQ